MADPWGWGWSLPVAGIASLAAWRLGAVNASGALAGLALATPLMALGGLPVLVALVLLVGLGSWASRRVAKANSLVPGDSRRSAVHAVANTGPALLALLLRPGPTGSLLACAALGAALSDTLSGEIGMLSGGKVRLLLVGPRVRPGRNGGMSLVGTLAGLLAAALTAGAVALSAGEGRVFTPVLAGGFAGTLADSLLGATVESVLPRRWGNEIVNFLASSAGAFVAWSFV